MAQPDGTSDSRPVGRLQLLLLSMVSVRGQIVEEVVGRLLN